MSHAASANTVSQLDQEKLRGDKLKRRAHTRSMIARVLTYVLLIAMTILIIFPLLIVLITSFTPNKQTQTWPPKVIPSSFTFDNYISLFQRMPIGKQMLNTVIFAGAVTIFSVFFDALAAYGLSRIDFKGRGFLLGILIATMMIPSMALLIPVYKLLASMNLVNSYWASLFRAWRMWAVSSF